MTYFSLVLLFSVDLCFEAGNNPSIPYWKYGKTSNAFECQYVCQLNPNCTHFTWVTTDLGYAEFRDCWLKGGIIQPLTLKEGNTSGPKYC
jgi:hypothetical protein